MWFLASILGDRFIKRFHKDCLHSVEITWIYCHSYSAKISWRNVFTKENTEELIWRIFFLGDSKFSFIFPHCVIKIKTKTQLRFLLENTRFFRQIKDCIVYWKEKIDEEISNFTENVWAWLLFIVIFHSLSIVVNQLISRKFHIWSHFMSFSSLSK